MVSISSQVPLDSGSSLSELCEQFRGHALSVRGVEEDTVTEEILYLRRFFDYFGSPEASSEIFKKITPEHLSAFLIYYAKAHPPGSRRWMQLSLRSFLRFAYHKSYLKRDLSSLIPAVRKVRMGHLPRGLPDTCIALLNTRVKPDPAPGRRDLAIIALLSTYGVRGVQIRQLRLDHIDWSSDSIHFPPAKGGGWIKQPLTTEVGRRLADYILNERPTSDFFEVFLTIKNPRPFPCASYLSGVVRRHIKRLGIDLPDNVSYGTHGFRHAFASRLISHAPFKELVDMLGHRDPSSTLIYGKIDINKLKEAALPWPGDEK